jgi:transcriptional regulator with XRE-family HTH domain
VIFAEFMREARLRAGLSQAQLAKQAECSAVFVCQIEAGERVPSDVVARSLAQALGLRWPEFLRSVYIARSAAAEDLFSHLDAQATASSEDQTTITEWAEQTFGPARSLPRVAARANEEMAELLRAVTADAPLAKVAEEIADVVIVLNRLASLCGARLRDEVERKMAINRSRTWARDETGHGYHTRDEA